MSTNNLPLHDSDLDLVTAAIELYCLRAMTDSTVPLSDFQRLWELSEDCWRAQAQRDAGGPVFETSRERYEHSRKQTT